MRYPLPPPQEGNDIVCYKVYWPSGDAYRVLLWGILQYLGLWIAYERDPAKRGTVVAGKVRTANLMTFDAADQGCEDVGNGGDGGGDVIVVPPPETIEITVRNYNLIMEALDHMSWFEIAQDESGRVYLRQSNGWHALQRLPAGETIIGEPPPDERVIPGGEIPADDDTYGGDTPQQRAGLTFAAAMHQILATTGDEYLSAATIPAGIETIAKVVGLVFGAQIPYSLAKTWSDIIEAAAPATGTAWANGVPVTLLSRLASEVACAGQPTDNAAAVKMTPSLQKGLIEVAKSGSGPYYRATLALFEAGLLDRWKSAVAWLQSKPTVTGTIPDVPLTDCGEEFGSGQVLQPDYVVGQEREVIFTATPTDIVATRPLYVATWVAEYDGRHVGWVADLSLLPRQVTSGYLAGDQPIANETGLLPLLSILVNNNVTASVGDIYAGSRNVLPGPAAPAAVPQWFPEATIIGATNLDIWQEIVEQGETYGIGTGMYTDAEAVAEFRLKLRAIYYTGA